MLNRINIAVCNMAVGAYGGQQEAIDAFRTNLAQLRRIALEGVDE